MMLSRNQLRNVVRIPAWSRFGEALPVHAMRTISKEISASPLRHVHTSLTSNNVVISSTKVADRAIALDAKHGSDSSFQHRSHSSSTGLHPTPAAMAEVSGSTSSSVSFDSDDFNFRAFGLARTGRTKLPTPLPPNSFDRRSVSLRKRLTQASNKKHLSNSQISGTEEEKDSPATSSMPFGDLTTATLQAIRTNQDYFRPTQTIEHLAILRACLNTGLIVRATKLFTDIRLLAQAEEDEFQNSLKSGQEQAENSVRSEHNPLDQPIYNAMISAYMRKAYIEENTVSSRNWVERAWSLLDGMSGRKAQLSSYAGSDRFTIDPRPDANSFAVMAKGMVRLMRSRRFPVKSPGLGTLLARMRQNDIHVRDVILSPSLSEENIGLQNITSIQDGEPDVRTVLQQFSSIAAEMADEALIMEIEEADRLLTSLNRKSEDGTSRTNPSQEGSSLLGEESQTDIEQIAAVQGKEPPAELLPVRSSPRAEFKSTQEGSSGADGDIAFNLRILKDNLSIVDQAKQASSDPYERQKWLEFSAIDAAQKRFDHANDRLEEIGLQSASKMQGRKLQVWMWGWYKKLEQELKADFERIRECISKVEGTQSSTAQRIELDLYPFLSSVPAKKLALITILELVRTQGMAVNGIKTAMALMNVGKQVEIESYAIQLSKTGELGKQKTVHAELRKRGISDMNIRKKLREMLEKDKDKASPALHSDWTSTIRARIGGFLIDRLIRVAMVKRKATDKDNITWDEEQPAFYSAYQYVQGKRLGVIKLNEIVGEELSKEKVPADVLSPRHLPMLVPPKPWTDHESGGYYSVKSRALRYKEVAEQGSYLRQASSNGDLDIVLAGLDVLGSTAWTINRDIYDVVGQVWNSGKDIGDIPPLNLAEEEPRRPANYETDISARNVFLKRFKHYRLRKYAAHSQRCDINYKLEIARAYLGEKFYFPHNMDFRGRAYPIPPHLNHIGNDLCRGLLLFAEGKPLGENGLRWLRIHLANVYGYDKASFGEREQFAIDKMDEVRASVQDPLGPDGGWWLKADDPWQCLATCFELSRAMDHPEGPQKYVCRLPVHQDGTCNGLQHYAALGGDLNGAKQVNLSGGDRPADVYTGIADLVIEAMEKEIEQGNPIAKKLQGKVTRKVVKQTVMTTVYGVTFIGAKEQVQRQLADRGDVAVEDLWMCASFLAKLIMDSIGDLFSGAEAIQDWLTKSASLIAKSIPANRLQFAQPQTSDVGEDSKDLRAARRSKVLNEQMTSVIWTSPLGLPVVQPYRKVVRKQLATAIQSVFLHDPQLSTQVSATKQSSAFPPNFIHSLDATHMFLTALECQQANLTFASVHDSYWTHACDIDTMNNIIRDTFIRLHSCEILTRLRDEFLERYRDHYIPLSSIRKYLNEVGRITSTASTDVEKEEEENGKEEEAESGSASIPGFVQFKDILPPIPSKGEFNVEEIRKSLYFFS